MTKTKSVQKISSSQRASKKDNRKEIFQKLRAILSTYSPPLTAVSDFDSRYELVSKKEAEWAGRKFKEMYFGAAITQSNYVGLYLMHVYAHPENCNKISPELSKCLKGKSCFHIKTGDKQLMQQIKQTVKDGFNFYKKVKFI